MNMNMLGSGGDGYEMGSKRQRMMESNPYFAVSHHPYYYGGVSAGSATSLHKFPVVRLRGLPFNCTDLDIFTFFAGLDIVDTLLVNKNGRFSGDAFVVFAGSVQADIAIRRDRQIMGRRYVEVFRCTKHDYYRAVAAEFRNDGIYEVGFEGANTPPNPKRRKDDEEERNDKERDVFTPILRLRGLPFGATKNEIVDFFGEEFGVAEERVHIACRADGKATGEAYVEFLGSDEAKRAMCKDKKMMGSRYVELFASTPAEARRAASRSRQ